MKRQTCKAKHAIATMTVRRMFRFPFQIVFKIYRAAAKAIQAYFLPAISLLASPAGEKSKIDAGEKSPFKPAVALSMAMYAFACSSEGMPFFEKVSFTES